MIRKIFLALVICLLSTNSNASLIFEDDFDNGMLDDHWEISFGGSFSAGTWNYQETGTELTVYGIGVTQRAYGLENYHPPAYIKLYHSLSMPLRDFELTTHISWNGSLSAMKDIWVYSDVVRFGLEDAWVAKNGFRNIGIYPSSIFKEEATLADEVNIRVIRTNNIVEFYWNEELLLSAYNDTLLEEISLQFDFYPYPTATFGTASIDYIRIEDIAIPEPATFLSLFCLLICWLKTRLF